MSQCSGAKYYINLNNYGKRSVSLKNNICSGYDVNQYKRIDVIRV